MLPVKSLGSRVVPFFSQLQSLLPGRNLSQVRSSAYLVPGFRSMTVTMVTVDAVMEQFLQGRLVSTPTMIWLGEFSCP